MTKPNLLIVGAGGVGAVAVHKAVQFRHEFGSIAVASRTEDKLNVLVNAVQNRYAKVGDGQLLASRVVNARDEANMLALIEDTGADIVLNVASPYCNETIIDACITAGVQYIDTAVAENEHTQNTPAPWYAEIEWLRKPRFAEKSLNALLGIGFDPGVVNVFCAYAGKHQFDVIETIDIIDVNAGDHGRYFATNFDPETNLREIMEDVVYWEDGAFKTIPPHSKRMDVTLPEVGCHTVYSMGHDELHSLPDTFPKAQRIEFWMGFGERYLQVFGVLNHLGLLSSIPVDVEGVNMAPLKMVKAVLPDPATLAEGYTGKVCIGCDITGTQDGRPKRIFVYSTCDHRACVEDTGSQAISYTTGVPAVAAALLLASGRWNPGAMVNVEELDPDPFLDLMPVLGIDWSVMELPVDGGWPEA